MKAKLTQNLALKIMAIIIAALVWLMVINIADPVKVVSFYQVPVELLNMDSVINEGKTVEVLDDSNSIDVTVSGPRSVVESIKKEYIKATADMLELTFMDTVEIQLSCSRYEGNSLQLSSKTKNLKVKVEDRASKQLPIEVVVEGTAENGYIIGSTSLEETVVHVQGPVSAVSKAVRAVAEVTVDGVSSTLSTSTNLKLYDSEDQEIPMTNVTTNINRVKVTVEILREKDVYLNVQVADTSAEGYGMTGLIETNPTVITVAGKGTAFNEMSVITIPETAIDITGARDMVEAVINVKKYLPNGVQLADSDFDGNVTVRVYVAALSEKTVQVPVSNITFTNVPDDVHAAFGDGVIAVPLTVRGLGAAYDLFDGSTAVGSIDMSLLVAEAGGTLEPGEYSAPVAFVLPTGISLKSLVQVNIQVVEGAGDDAAGVDSISDNTAEGAVPISEGEE